MKLRNDVPLPGSVDVRSKRGFLHEIFRLAKHGDSVHVTDAKKAGSMQVGFIKWRHNKPNMKIIRRAVGAEDPDGPGYRLFFVEMPETPRQPNEESVWGAEEPATKAPDSIW